MKFRTYRISALCLAVAIIAASSFTTARDAMAQTGPKPLRPINIVTEPGATVWIDGVKYGTTDEKGRLVVTSVLPGVRSLRLRAKGFAQVTRPIPATARGDVVVKMVKTTDAAELAFQSAEEQTTIDREKAIAEYRRAIKLRPNYPDAYLGLARAFSERGDIEGAHQAIQNAKRLRSVNAEVSAVEARVLKDSGEEEKAIATFKRAIVQGKGFQPEAYTGLGLLYKDRAENAGGSGDFSAEATNYDEAIKNLAIAVEQLGSAPDGMIVQQLLGLIYERQKRYKEAIALYEDFLRLFPDSPEAAAVASFIVQIKKQMNAPK